jgi:hypothetical protein
MTRITERLVELLVQADVPRTHGAVGDSRGRVVDAVPRSLVDRVHVRDARSTLRNVTAR